MRQVAQFAHAIPHWQQYAQQLQRIREADNAAQPTPQLALQDAPQGSPAASYSNSPRAGAPIVRGPDGLASQVVATTAESDPGTTESFMIHTPRSSPQPEYTGRSMVSMRWRATSSPRGRRDSRSTPPSATDVAARTSPYHHRFTFGGNKPRPAQDVPQLPMDVVKGYVVVDGRKGNASTEGRGNASPRDAILDAQDESLRRKREALKMGREILKKERAVFHQENNESEAILRQELQASWNHMQQHEQGGANIYSATAQTRRTFQLQERNIDELKELMSTFSADVKATFAEIAHAQKGHELGFNMVRAELWDLAGGMNQVVTKTQELESAMEDWTEQEGLETWDEEK